MVLKEKEIPKGQGNPQIILILFILCIALLFEHH